MAVFPPDQRRIIRPEENDFTRYPLPAVTAIDTTIDDPRPFGYGTGIVISPNYILTAAHNLFDKSLNKYQSAIRVSSSGRQNSLVSRRIGEGVGDPGANVDVTNGLFFPAPEFFDTPISSFAEPKHDIALIKVDDNDLISSAPPIGLIAFVDTRNAIGKEIQTAGYPADNVPNTYPLNNPSNPGIPDSNGVFTPDPDRQLRDLVLAPGSFNQFGGIARVTGRRMAYTTDIDTVVGQSGSPVWHTLDGDSIPRVLGVHSRRDSQRNTGTLIDKEVYDLIIEQMEGDEDPELLPENAIIGSNPGFFSPITGGGNDTIFGTYRRERIIGNGGNDRLFGGGATDRLEGGEGVDQALFTDVFTNYDVLTPNSIAPGFEFIHLGGDGSDGIDTTEDIEFGVFEFADTDGDGNDDDGNLFYVPLQVDPNDSSKLKDGPEISPSVEILNDQEKKVGAMTVQSPAWMFDGDVEYTLNIGTEPGEIYQIAYLIDTSGSIGGSLEQVKNAFRELTQSFFDNGFAFTTQFLVVGFKSGVNATVEGIDGVIPFINSLSAGGGTNFQAPLSTAVQYYKNPERVNRGINLAYFVSDGLPNSIPYIAQANELKELADVRALGIGGANLATLNSIDSGGNAAILGSAGDLFDEFNSPRIDKENINRIVVRVAGEEKDTIFPGDLTQNGANFTFEGTIDGLEVSREAENEITFELFFNDATPSVSLDYKITTGQEQIRQQTNNGRREIITFSVNQNDFFDPQDSIPFSSNSNSLLSSRDSFLSFASTEIADPVSNIPIEREIVANDFDNTILIRQGQNTILGNRGDDRFILLGGVNLVNGGEGTDTVVVDQTQAEAGGVSKVGNIVNIGTDQNLLNVEYIEFRDVRIATDTLTIVPVVSFADKAIVVSEGDAGSTFVTFRVYLSSTTTENVIINIVPRSNFASAGIDFVSPINQLTIPAGRSSGELTLEILGDLDIEGNEEIYLDLTIASGATFANEVLSETIGVNIVDNEINLVTDEDTPLVIPANKLLGDYAEQLYGDFTTDDFSLVEVSNSVNGTVYINGEGNVEFIPDANFNGIASFNYTVTDGTDDVTEIAEITVISVNDPLTANNDSVTTNEDISLTILASELFSNDINLDTERQLSISKVDNFVNGTANVNISGDIEFTPDANFNGIAAFDYTVTDGIDSETAPVSVVVNAVNDPLIANNDTVTTNEDTSIIISASELFDNDVNNDIEKSLSVSNVNKLANGTATINSQGNIEFTPNANFNGIASFDYTVTDGTDSSTTSVSVIVNPINDPLIVNDDTATTDEDVSITILASDLFDNDINPDLKDSRISNVSNTVNGTANINAQGNIEFTPDANFNGVATFDYTVTDGIDSETASVEVTVNAVNDVPVANSDTFTTDEDTPVTILATELLSNDTDVETQESLNITEVKNAVNGTVSLNEFGNIEFTPDANFNGTASFDYTITDGTDSSTASVSVIVNPINDPLIANNDTATTDEDTPIVILASELFDNDVNNDIEKSLSISSVDNSTNGTVAINSQGDVEFTPDLNFNGTASFDYTVTEGTDIETASVSVTVNAVNDVPVANSDTFTTDEDTPVTILATELLSNDTDVETQESLNITEVNNAVGGTVSLNEFGNIEFIPDLNFNGTASFDYTLTDNTDNTTGKVEIVVNPVNDTPFITTPLPDLNIPQNSPNSIINFADYFEDIEQGDNLRYETSISNSWMVDSISFDPVTRALVLDYADNFIGMATVTARVVDSMGEFAEDAFDITIFGVDNTDVLTTNEDTAVTVSARELLSNDGDSSGESLSLIAVKNIVNGTVVLRGDEVEFTPHPNFSGTATFDYLVFSSSLGVREKTVEVIVNPVNDAPVVTTPIPNITVNKNAPNSVIELTNYFDDVEDGSNLAYSLSSSSSFTGGTSGQFFDLFALDPTTKALTLDYAEDVVGTSTITVKATDSEGEFVEDTFTVSVVDTVNIAANNDTVTTDEDTSITILPTDLLGNDEGDNLTLVGVDNPNGGTAIINELGNIEFTPDAEFNGTASFDYSISDGANQDTASVSVVVNPINDVPILINPIPNITVNKNAPNSVIELINYFDDVEDGSNLAYSLSSSSSFTGGTSGQFFDLFALDPTTKALTLDYAEDVVGTSTINVVVTDSNGSSVETSFNVEVLDAVEPPVSSSVIAEFGSIVDLAHETQTITLDQTFTNPVAFVQPLSFNGSQPATVRLDNITGNSFDVRIQEPNYLDGIHIPEQVSYFVFEAGSWQLENGALLEVGTIESSGLVNGGASFDTVDFDASFASTPAIFSQVQTDNDADFVRTRQRNSSITGFAVGMEEEEANKNSGHGSETVGWMAIETGSGQWDDFTYFAERTGDRVNHNWTSVEFDSLFAQQPQIMANMSTYDGPDSAGLRYRNLDLNGVDIKVEEEKSLDSETNHTTENVDLFLVEGSGSLSAVNAIDPLLSDTALGNGNSFTSQFDDSSWEITGN